VSGTYMQVLPRFFSVDEDGSTHDFLLEQFDDPYLMLSLVFLKGYQWPFDVRKVSEGSSIIDLLVYRELEQGRRVYLDFAQNPVGGPLDFAALQPEAYTYLKQSGATFGLPIDRLKVMNTPAYDFYREHGIDLAQEPLEISLCAQHNNGGVAVDLWWQSTVRGMFAVGEVAGTHGVYRPGGSALNAGQVGSARAASYILAKRHDDSWQPSPCCLEQVNDILNMATEAIGPKDTAFPVYRRVRKLMSMHASLIREQEAIEALQKEVVGYLKGFSSLQVESPSGLPLLFRLRDCLLSQTVYLSAMAEYLKAGGTSRGSSLYLSKEGQHVHPLLPSSFRSHLATGDMLPRIQEITLKDGEISVSWRDPHPIPKENVFFETVWKAFREHGNIL
ncbi:MAG TPA: FAD-binding protein, partial [Sphaerochaeta sp.]|nr:FAD-binding protein [Sphaerochaeta sp.]